ncbi:MAG: hypothetical protein C0501_30705 [Isosphaera sp.]|nr:hypothetical protein [Isosphaera sp.]
MTVRKSVFAWPALAVGAAALATPTPVHAFGRDVFRQRTVVRGDAPVLLGAPGVVVGTGTRAQSVLLGPGFGVAPQSFGFVPQSFSFGVAPQSFGFVPQSFSFGGIVPQSGLMLGDPTPQAAGLKSPGAQGTPGPAPAAGSGCPELAARLDKIEGRLTTLEAKLAGIEAKVDALAAERGKRAREEEQARLVAELSARMEAKQNELIVALNDRRAKDNRALVTLMEEFTRPKPDQDKIAEAKKALGVP